MKPKVEALLKTLLLIAILVSTSLVSFADSKKTHRKKKAAAKPATVTAVNMAPPLNATPTPTAGDSVQSALTPKLKRRHKVAIVPAPPPGQIPVYVPEKR